MIAKDKEIQVTNRDRGSVGYEIPDLGNLNRQFQAGETKTLTFEELEKLSWIPGGDYLLKNCLMIDDPEAVEALLNHVEPEYYYTEKELIKLMTTGSLNQFLDCLDFAPQGVLDMVKDLAIRLPLNDVAKREAILEKLGFDVTNALRIKEETEDDKKEQEQGSKRRAAAPVVDAEKPVRRYIKATPQ